MAHAVWRLAAPPGFQGLREDLPLSCYHEALPHWRQDGAAYFVTFRLRDSLPQAKLQELKAYRAFARRCAVVDSARVGGFGMEV